jgi:hypothetical protein
MPDDCGVLADDLGPGAGLGAWEQAETQSAAQQTMTAARSTP